MIARRHSILLLIAVALTALLWWLFGFSTTYAGGGSVRAYRYFGRVIRLDCEWNGDGVVDQRWRYSFSQPAVHHAAPLQILSDDDGDGRWDRWTTPLGSGDATFIESARFDVDTDGDGKPDWSFVDRWHSDESQERIRARRGF